MHVVVRLSQNNKRNLKTVREYNDKTKLITRQFNYIHFSTKIVTETI